MKLCEPSFIFS